MSALPALNYLTVEDYLEQEEKSAEKHEYYKGELFAMAGASIDHNKLVRDTLLSIGNYLERKSCEIFPSDLRIHVTANSLFTYPDLSIFCDPPVLYKKRTDTATNPTVIIEVLSPSTEDYDRGSKFSLYREIVSLKEYLLISSTRVLVEKYTRLSEREWQFTEYKNREEILHIQAIGFSITIDQLYRNVQWEEPAEA